MSIAGRISGGPLRVLAADEDRDALAATVALLEQLGHEVTALAVGVREAAEQIAADDPDLAVVVLHDDVDHALELIEEIAEFATGPVIAVAAHADASFAQRAAERGIDAVAAPPRPETIQRRSRWRCIATPSVRRWPSRSASWRRRWRAGP